jgi:uncharacterized protein YgiM (DUF1202 family)
MNRSKKVIAAGVLTLGLGAGAVISTPQVMKASSNVVLASVDWVTSQLNPMKTKISELESKIASQQQEINTLKAQVSNPGTTTPPVVTPPVTGDLPSSVYAKGTVNVHSGATKEYKVVATKTSGSLLKVIDSHKSATGLWYRVELSSTLKGWVFSGDVSIEKPANAEKVVVTFGDVNLRKGATTSYASLQVIPKGTNLKYISSFTNAAGEVWHNVQTAAGIKGWVIGSLSEVK